jgi:hypothetical protein
MAGVVILVVVVGAVVAGLVMRAQAAGKQKAGRETHTRTTLGRLSAALEQSGALDGRLVQEPWDEVRGAVFDVRIKTDSALMTSSDPALHPTLETLSRACIALLEHPVDADAATAQQATTQFCETAKLVRPLLPPPSP